MAGHELGQEHVGGEVLCTSGSGEQIVMSRMGNGHLCAEGVEIQVTTRLRHVKGPKGVLEQQLPAALAFEARGRCANGCAVLSDNREHRSLHGLTRSFTAIW